MKKYLIFFGILATVGCSKKYLDVNENPNTATSTKANYVFANATNITAADLDGRMGAQSLGSTWAGFWGHSTSFTGGGQEKTYVFTNNDFNFFDTWFDNLNDYQYVINNAAKDGFAHLVGPSKVMQCFVWQKLVDTYGNIPYSEALQGTNHTYPKFDDAKTIYESLITKLSEAISDINGATWPANEPADILFNANKTRWVQFANTLKLRILIRQTNMSGRDAYITGAINAISGGFLNDNVYVQPGFTKTSGKLNPFYGNYGYDQNDQQTGTFAYRKMNAVIINWFKNTSDLFRIQRVATPKAGGNPTTFADYTGVPMGAPTGFLEAACSSIGSEQIKLGDASRSAILMTAAESYFLQAEAGERYGLLGSAATNYANGVTWAFRLSAATQTGTSSATNAQADAAATTYLTSSYLVVPGDTIFINYPVTNTQARRLRSIWVQKWTALCNMDGWEAWAEYRRTNNATTGFTGSVPYSPHSVAIPAASPEPVRLYYPLREVSVNSANVPVQTSASVFTDRIFWDVN